MIQIRIHQLEPVLDQWLKHNGYMTWAFITAWNPIGESDHQLKQNIGRNDALLADLQLLNGMVLPGWGIPDAPEWPPEASFLVLGISKEDATVISARYGQRAFVFGEKGAKAQLCILDNNKHDEFHATTYVVSPLNLQHGKSLETWLRCLRARRVCFSTLPIDCLFVQPYQTGYLCWLSS